MKKGCVVEKQELLKNKWIIVSGFGISGIIFKKENKRLLWDSETKRVELRWHE